MLKQRILQDLRAWRPPLNNSKNHRVGVIGLVTTPVLAPQEGHPDAHHGCFYKSRLGAHLNKLVGEENFDPATGYPHTEVHSGLAQELVQKLRLMHRGRDLTDGGRKQTA
jgi:hypothetical protein